MKQFTEEQITKLVTEMDNAHVYSQILRIQYRLMVDSNFNVYDELEKLRQYMAENLDF